MLSMSRLQGFLLGLGLLFLVWRVWRAVRPATSRAPRGASGAGGRAWCCSRCSSAAGSCPTGRCCGWRARAPNLAAVDFHSHTNASHDVRGHRDARASTRSTISQWHQRAGFDAVFITDHNTTAGLVPVDVPVALCRGREVSAWRAHIVLLGGDADRSRVRTAGTGRACCQLLADADTAYGVALGRLASGIRAQSLGTARLAGRRGTRRLRDRKRLAQGQRAHPRAARHGDRARPAHRKVRGRA